MVYLIWQQKLIDIQSINIHI